jgi:ATP dependent DNA ligase C terminal region
VEWCTRCGYCKTVKEPAALERRPVRPSRPFHIEVFEELKSQLRIIPDWYFGILKGICVILALSFVASYFTPEESRIRAVVGTVQVVVALVALGLANFRMLTYLVANDSYLGIADLVMPWRLWKQGLQAMPLTRGSVFAAAWSLTAIICGLFIVGGQTYWLQFYKPARGNGGDLLATVGKLAKGVKKKGVAAEDLSFDLAGDGNANGGAVEVKVPRNGAGAGGTSKSGMVDATIVFGETSTESLSGQVETARCTIIGFATYPNGDISKLLVAFEQVGQLRYAGTVGQGLSSQTSDTLLKYLNPELQDSTDVPAPAIDASWVKPRLRCEIAYDGLDEDRHVKNASFRKLLTSGPDPEPRTAGEFSIAGYLPGDAEHIKGLVLAKERGGQLCYVGTVSEGITPAQHKDILAKLSSLQRKTPAIPGVTGDAVWIETDQRCEVSYRGFDKDKYLNAPIFRKLVKGGAAVKPAERASYRCLIAGYTLNPEGQVSALVVGVVRGTKLHFAGIVERGILEDDQKQLLERLERRLSTKPIFPGLDAPAIWVQPKISCNVYYSGFDSDDQLIEPRLKSLMPEDINARASDS